MSEEELNEAMQYNLDYTEAMLNDELFGTNEVAEVKLLASEKAIEDLQQKVKQLEKENEYLKMSNPEQNMEHFRIVNENKRKIDMLRKENHQLENIRKETIEEIQRVLDIWTNKPNEIATLDLEYLLNILSKGDNK